MANAVNNNQENQNKNQGAPNDPNKAYNQYIDPDFKKKQKKKKLLLMAGAITAAMIILAIVAAVAFFASSDRENTPEKPIQVMEVCEDEQCFEEKFALCHMATYEGQGPEDDSKAEYKIPGIADVGCLVTVKYLESKNQEIIGKEMTCDFDNELSFQEALELVDEYPEDYECEGSLVDFYNEIGDEVEMLYGI